MPWDRSLPTDPKYRSTEHRTRRAELVAMINAGQPLACTAKTCVFNRAPITNPNGRDPDGLHLGHADNGVDYDGPQHNQCNVKDGARRASARSHGTPEGGHWIL